MPDHYAVYLSITGNVLVYKVKSTRRPYFCGGGKSIDLLNLDWQPMRCVQKGELMCSLQRTNYFVFHLILSQGLLKLSQMLELWLITFRVFCTFRLRYGNSVKSAKYIWITYPWSLPPHQPILWIYVCRPMAELVCGICKDHVDKCCSMSKNWPSGNHLRKLPAQKTVWCPSFIF